jgi:dCTP deaminase
MPMFQQQGVLPGQFIRQMMSAGFIHNARGPNVSPASLDLTLSDEVYEVDSILQVRKSENVRELLSTFHAKEHPKGGPFMRGHMYLARIKEELELPIGVYGYCNPKSTTGRLDVHVRVIADRVPRFDSLEPAGWSGELWIAILPNSFSILPAENQTLSQVRFFTADTRFSELELQLAMAEDQLLWTRDGEPIVYKDLLVSDRDGGLALSLDFSGEWNGWRSKCTDEVVDLSQKGGNDAGDFFEPVRPENGHMRLESGKFYILSTKEYVRVPPGLACEMSAMDERFGDFRSHYAGFIDPGWGYGKAGETYGRPLTLEVRPFEDLIIRPGQVIAKTKFERMMNIPDVLYDEHGGNYSEQQQARLAKQFKY